MVISTDPWEDQSSSKQEQSRETESEKQEETLFGFQDLASDYYQVIFLRSKNIGRNFQYNQIQGIMYHGRFQ